MSETSTVYLVSEIVKGEIFKWLLLAYLTIIERKASLLREKY